MRFSRRSAGEVDEPTNGERTGAALWHLDRYLVVRAADAARADLEHRCHGLDRLLEYLDGRLARTLADPVERLVDDLLGRRLLAVAHDAVDQLRDETRVVDRIRLGDPHLDFGSPRHD